MANFNLINAILRGVWLIDEGYVNNSLLLIKSILEGKTIDFKNQFEFDRIENASENSESDREEFSYWLRAIDGNTGKLVKRVAAYNDLPENSIAVINNYGPMMKNDTFCGPAGTQTRSEMINSANRSSKIKSIIIDTDSPGGSADSVEVMKDAIKNSQKKVLTFVNGLSASASVWATSPSHHIIANGETSMLGSIGTMMNYMDIEPALEKIGYKFHKVRATESIEKNEDFYQMQKGNYKKIRESMLDPLNDMFLNGMKENRPKMEKTFEQWHEGKVFFSDKAIEIGLADEKGDFTLAVKRAHELADGRPIEIPSQKEEKTPESNAQVEIQETNSQSKSNANMKWKKKFKAALSFLGFGDQVAESDLPEINESHIESLNQGIEDITAENKRLETELSTANTELQNMTTDRDQWKAKAEQYGEQPGATPSTPKSEGDTIEESAEQKEEMAINSMAHNRKADEFLGSMPQKKEK